VSGELTQDPPRPAPALVGVARVAAFVVFPVLVAVVFLRWQHSLGVLGFDFRGTLWEPGEAILAGRSPYPAADPAAIATGNPAVYPPAMMLATAPLTLLPWGMGLGVWTALSLAAAAGALWLLDVRDWRVYGIALSTEPLLYGVTYGNVTMLLLLGLAAAWRYRDSTWPVALVVAGLIVMKLFLWPLVVWLVVTRRFKAAILSVVIAAATGLGSWAAIGFDGLTAYPDLLRALDEVYSAKTQSVTALGLSLGLGDAAAKLVAVAIGLGVLGLGVALARRAGGDRRMFTAALVAAILITPVAWIYYYALLLVPIALASRAFSAVWLLPLAFWIIPFLPGTANEEPPCCAPAGMPEVVWRSLTTDPSSVLLAGHAALLAAVAWATLRARSEPDLALERAL